MEYRYFVGIDWATERHEVSVLDAKRSIVAKRSVEHRGDSLSAFFDDLVKLADGRPELVAVGIETPRGALVESMVERGFHVYAINPKQLDRFRDRHSVAGAKDDPLDAFVLGDSLRTDLQCFRRVRIDDPVIIQIRELSRLSEGMKIELGRLCNQLRDQVHRLLPQLLKLSPAADERWLWDLLAIISSGADPARVPPHKVRRVLKDNRIRRFEADEVLALLRQPAPWTTPGTQQAVRSHMVLLLPLLRTALEQNRRCEQQIEALIDALAAQEPAQGEMREHRDVSILQSLPGAGKVVVATMLAEASQPLAERDYQALRAEGGIAPVTRATGKRSKNRATVVMRYACNGRLRNAYFFWAQSAVTLDPRAKALYAAHRGHGQSHGRALRSVTDSLLRTLVAMLKSTTLYDPARSLTPGQVAP